MDLNIFWSFDVRTFQIHKVQIKNYQHCSIKANKLSGHREFCPNVFEFDLFNYCHHRWYLYDFYNGTFNI